MNRLQAQNEQLVSKVLRKGKIDLVIEEIYFKDIPKNQREEYTQFFKKIWNIPLLHNERSTNIIQAFWKEILRRSYLANKSNQCLKFVCKYGEHYRQKFSMYCPKQKPVTPIPIVIYVHGGYFINGSEQAFEYLGRKYVEKGYIFVSMGFRQLPQYRWPDPYDDCHEGYKQVINRAPQFGGDPNNIIYLSWSGGGLVVLTNFFRFTSQYQNRVKLFVAVGSPWQISVHQQKVAKVMVDNQTELLKCLPYGYMGQKLSIPINLVTGTKDKQFPQIYQHNQKYYKVYKQNGLNVTLNEVQNHDHYDLILDEDVGLTKIRQHEIRNIDRNNQISRLFTDNNKNLKNKVDQLLKNPLWIVNSNDSLEKLRLDTVQRFRQIQNLLTRDQLVDYSKLFSLLEFVSASDWNSATKSLTHWSASSTINFVGTKKHQKVLDQVAEGKIVFAYCLTEAGGGNNLSDCGTKATYDEKTQQFIFHNESHYSKKFLCANLGMHANYAVVFAKLIVKGKNEGTHAFVVRIRDQNHQPLSGIIIEDLGHKIGLNGIDNGALMFKNHRINKDCLLNRYSDIDDEGNYKSSISKISERFFKVIERLLAGRIFVASSMTGTLKRILIAGVMFSRYRYGISETGVTQVPIGNYQIQRNDIIPVVSKAIAILFFHQYCKNIFINDNNNVELSNICNINKIYITQHTVDAAIIIRERCGGQGILSVNNLGQYLGAAMGASTGEGDNKVLMMKIAKDYLKLVGTKKLQLPTSKITKIIALDQLQDLDVIFDLFKRRQLAAFKSLTTKIVDLKNKRKQTFDIVMKYSWEQMKALSSAYGNRMILQGALSILSQFKNLESIDQIKTHLNIFGLSCIVKNSGFYAYSGVIPQSIANQIIELQNHLIRKATKNVQLLVHKLGVQPHCLTSPIDTPDYFKHIESGLTKNNQVPPSL